MRGNSLVYQWKIEGTSPRRRIMHGEHDTWDGMMRFAEYATCQLGVKDRCNVVWICASRKGMFPLDPVMYEDNRLYKRARINALFNKRNP